MPTSLSIQNSHRTLAFKCRACAHEWSLLFTEEEWEKALGGTTGNTPSAAELVGMRKKVDSLP